MCGSGRQKTVLEAPEPGDRKLWFAVVRCDRCGLCFTSPRPDVAGMAGFYPPDYPPYQPRGGRPARPARWARLRGRPSPERRTLPVVTGARLLDVGCGSGDYLARIRDQGWSVTGLDISPTAAATAAGRYGVTVLTGTLPHPDLRPGSFDAVTFWQSLEHLHDPLAALRAARDLLVPGGRVYVSVPNFAGRSARRFGRDWIGLDLPRHLTHFSPDSLRAMLAAAGLDVLTLRSESRADWVRRSAAAGRRPSWLARRPIARIAAWLAYLAGEGDCLFAVARPAPSAPSPLPG